MALFNRILLAGFLFQSSSLLLVANNPHLEQDLVKRRERVLEEMNGRGMLVLFSADFRTYSRDITYKFRQENNLYYLTGISQQGIILVLMPQNLRHREILFLPDSDPQRELWTGSMLTAEQAIKISGIPNVWKTSEFKPFMDSVLYGRTDRTGRYSDAFEYEGFLTDLMKGQAQIFLLLDSRSRPEGQITKELTFANLLEERFTSLEIKDASSIFGELRVIKSKYELEQIQKAIDITASAQSEVMKHIFPGNWEYEIEALVEFEFKNKSSLGWAFPPIVASGENTTILHYDKSERQTQEGELLLIDIGAQYNYYAADITRTIPCNGIYSPEQAEIYQLVLKAQNAAMEEIKPGSSLSSIHWRAVNQIKEGLLHLGLITDKTEGQYRIYFPHRTAHFLGLDVHDVGPHNNLRPGSVLTVEPGIYIRQDSAKRLAAQGVTEDQLKKIRPSIDKYMSIGVRIEDDVLVTRNGYQLLSRNIPREITDIELLMSTTTANQ